MILPTRFDRLGTKVHEQSPNRLTGHKYTGSSGSASRKNEPGFRNYEPIAKRRRLGRMEAMVWLLVPLTMTMLAAALIGFRDRGLRSARKSISGRVNRLQAMERTLVEADRPGGDEFR